MEEIIKKAFEEVYTHQCFSLSERGEVHTLVFLIKDKQITPVLLAEGVKMDINKYISTSLISAQDNDADAILLIGEQYMVNGKKGDKGMQKILSGEIKVSEHPDRKEHLVLSYMTAEGETEILFGEIITNDSGNKYVTDQKWMHKATSNILTPWR